MPKRKPNLLLIYCSLLLLLGGSLIGIGISTKGVQFGMGNGADDYNLRLYTESSTIMYHSGIATNNTINDVSQLSMNILEASTDAMSLEVTYDIDNLLKSGTIKLDLVLFGLFTENTRITCLVNGIEHLLHSGVSQILQANGKINLLNFISEMHEGSNDLVIKIENNENVSQKSFVVTTFLEKTIRESHVLPVINNVLHLDYKMKVGYQTEVLSIQMPFNDVKIIMISIPSNTIIVNEQVSSLYYQVVLQDGNYEMGFYEVD